ncbi:RNA polymerase sigma factor [Tautonia rosea]|uniref:RNA polymerase sigma factor n=1 Tax=Tautonia rosea TaxID=2728037 RepID=UPI00147384BA|nr:sigma-70 family RNA polymerase sigma factor [Tautonia rosea]
MEPHQIGRLIDRHADALVLFARQWCDTPEDVVQEAFVALAGQRPTPENPAAWLFRAVRNGAINAAKAARRRRQHESNAALKSPDWFEASPSDADAIDPEAAEVALRTLPIEQREAIVAHLWGGLTFEQIGAMSGRSSSAAHRLYQSGLKTLRQRLGVPCPTQSRTSRPRGD